MAGAGQLLAGLGPLAALGTPRRRLVGIAAKVAIGDHLDFGQQGGQPTRGGRLGRAPLATDEDSTDLRMDGVQYQRPLQALLSDDGRKWKDWHGLLQGRIIPQSGENESTAQVQPLSHRQVEPAMVSLGM